MSDAKATPDENDMAKAEACYLECEQMDSYGIILTIARYINAERVDLKELDYRAGAQADYENHVQHLRQARDWE